MKKLLFIFLSLTFILTQYTCVFAENNPTDVPDNKFGIHITDEKDLPDAAALVNSTGGDWGYVTFVITEAERNHDRWQQTFDQMRKLHLIPIVRIATKANGNIWEIPNSAEINNWIAFLNSLNWVIQNRYIIISNEPNHASEWGGKIDPESYASYLMDFSKKLKSASPDFFILSAGLDSSAKNTKDTIDEVSFLKRMLVSEPTVFDYIDGWASHSYPNPDFSGKATDVGRGTIGGYNWELNTLKSLGVLKEFPVFITETGWSIKNTDADQISENLSFAFEKVWNDSKVVAVTPFILNYPQAPFSEFSWKKPDGSFYPYYSAIQKISKITGMPIQIDSGQILGALAQPISLLGTDYFGAILVKNTGQSIWNVNNTLVRSDEREFVLKDYSLGEIEPMRLGLIFYKALSSDKTGLQSRSLYLSNYNGKRITNSFPTESLIVNADKIQISSFFDKLFGFMKSKQFLQITK